MPIEMALAAGLALVLGWRVYGGYPKPGARLARLSRREAAFVAAAAEALFPRGGAVPPSGLDAGIPAWCDRWLDALPAGTRRLVRALLALGEHARLVFTARSAWCVTGGREWKMTPATLETLRRLYPDDAATGFKMGDLRGAWRIDFSLTALLPNPPPQTKWRQRPG